MQGTAQVGAARKAQRINGLLVSEKLQLFRQNGIIFSGKKFDFVVKKIE